MHESVCALVGRSIIDLCGAKVFVNCQELGSLSKETFIINNIRLTSNFVSYLSLIKHKGSTGMLEILALC